MLAVEITHSGGNVRFTADAPIQLGFGFALIVAAIQLPQGIRRTVLEFAVRFPLYERDFSTGTEYIAAPNFGTVLREVTNFVEALAVLGLDIGHTPDYMPATPQQEVGCEFAPLVGLDALQVTGSPRIRIRVDAAEITKVVQCLVTGGKQGALETRCHAPQPGSTIIETGPVQEFVFLVLVFGHRSVDLHALQRINLVELDPRAVGMDEVVLACVA